MLRKLLLWDRDYKILKWWMHFRTCTDMGKRGRMQCLRSPQLCKPRKFYSSDIPLSYIISSKILFWQAEHLKNLKCLFLKCSERQSTLMCVFAEPPAVDKHSLHKHALHQQGGAMHHHGQYSPIHFPPITREESQLCTAGSAWCQSWENHRIIWQNL